MHLWEIFGTALAVGFSGAMTPGSLLVADIQASAREGFPGGGKVVAGHALAELTLTVLLILGLNNFLAEDRVAAMISMAGAAVLLWMGYTIIRDSLADKLKLDTSLSSTESSTPSALLGLIATVSNPYWLLWWATIGSSYVVLSQRQAGTSGLFSFYFGHISADIIWYALITAAVVSGRRFISQRIYRSLLLICGAFLLLLAIYFVITGFSLLK